MAYTRLTAQQIVNTGIAPSYAAAAEAGNDFVNDGRVFLHVKNTGTIKVMTIATPRKVDGLDVEEVTVTIPATTGDKVVGPFAAETFNQAGGLVYVTYDSHSDVTVALLRL